VAGKLVADVRERRDFRWLNEPLRLIGYIPPFGAFLRFREPRVGGILLVAVIPLELAGKQLLLHSKPLA
jgi:hypothetical protein